MHSSMRIVMLDDYRQVAVEFADWDGFDADVTRAAVARRRTASTELEYSPIIPTPPIVRSTQVDGQRTSSSPTLITPGATTEQPMAR